MAGTLSPAGVRRRRPVGGPCPTQICVRIRPRPGDDVRPRPSYRRRVSAAPSAPRWDRRDLVPALPLLAIGLAATQRAAEQQPDWVQPLDAGGSALISVAALALLARRRAPVVALVLSGLAITVYLAL